MKIEINVTDKKENLNPKILDRLRRITTVLSQDGIEVQLSFTDKEYHTERDNNSTPFIGAQYQHQGHLIRLSRQDSFMK